MTDTMISHEDRVGVWLPRWAMIECEGDARDALVYAQITYWLQPAQKTGQARTTQLIERDGHLWLYLTDAELGEEIGMDRGTVYRARRSLQRRGLIDCRRAQVNKQTVSFVRVVEQEGYRENATGQRENASPLSRKRVTPVAKTRNAPSIERAERELPTRGTPLSLLPEVPAEDSPAEPVDDFEETFAVMWADYPPRDGKRLKRPEAIDEWRKLSLEDRRAAHQGAKNLAEAVTAGGRFGVPDLFRWLQKRRWEEWQEPAKVEGNGKRDFMADQQAGWVPRLSETHIWKVDSL